MVVLFSGLVLLRSRQYVTHCADTENQFNWRENLEHSGRWLALFLRSSRVGLVVNAGQVGEIKVCIDLRGADVAVS